MYLYAFSHVALGWTSTPHQLPADAKTMDVNWYIQPSSPIPGGFHEFLHGFKPKHHCDFRALLLPLPPGLRLWQQPGDKFDKGVACD